MAIQHVTAGNKALASEQNALIDQANATAELAARNASTLDSLNSTVTDHGNRITALESAPTPNLDSLADVTTYGAAAGQVLKYDGSQWAPGIDQTADGGTGASKLDDLTDVSTAGATDGQVLKYSGGTWSPAPDNTGDSSGGASTLDQLDDVDTSGATSGRALVFNGSTWAPAAPVPAQHTHAIGDVTGLQAALDGKATTTSVNSINGRVTNLENAASTLYPTTASDTLLYGDVISSHQRSDCQWGESLGNGYMTAVATRSPKTFTATDLRLCVTTAATGTGTFDLKLYTGNALSALTERVFRFGDTHVTTTGVKHIDIGSLAITEGDYIALCMIVSGWTGSPRLSSTPTGSGAQLLIGEKPYSVYQAGQTFPPPASLDMTESKWTRANQLFWFGLA